MDLDQIWAFFASFPEPLTTPRSLARIAEAFGRQENLWRPMRHDAQGRWYARLYEDDRFNVWLSGWEQGEATRLHDHGGSAGGVYVAEGTLTEDYGQVTARRLRRRTHAPRTAFAFGASTVHDLRSEAAAPATSVHVYSPPLASMTYYDPAPDGRLRPVETVLKEAWGTSSADRKMPDAEVG